MKIALVSATAFVVAGIIIAVYCCLVAASQADDEMDRHSPASGETKEEEKTDGTKN